MKRNFTLFACIFCMLFNLARAAETEPNNVKAQANTLALNGSNSGAISPAGDEDWWKITTTSDGKLDIALSVSSGKYVWLYLYDNNGTTLLNSTNSNTNFTLTTDGLAAGTYFVKVVCYYGTDVTSYTISNTLTTPPQANDAEPNNTKSQAITLPQNGSKTGHTGYYFNNVRDTVDWYKITTNADGQLKLSLTPANGAYVWIYLYDNDGTTLINSSYSNAVFTQLTDGLAAGTYFVRVNCYYSNNFAPYKLQSSLILPVEANNIEPNNTKAQAFALTPNSATEGHVGYYFNNVRDTVDWYKITTNADGQLKLSLTPANGAYVWIYLYDNDGTTLINSSYSNAVFSQLTDGLAAGTYFVRVNCYYSNNFAPYTFSDTLLAYNNSGDAESNAKPYLAQTLAANTATSGHVGFYYKNVRDTIDWWKINYTGNGALSVTLNVEPTKSKGGDYTYLEIYKDTNASALYSQYTTTNLTASFTGLAQGYYWVRVREYYSNSFESYTLTPTFTQVKKASIQLVSSVTAADCSSTNSLTLKCSGSKPPYRVQLLRFGTNYGSVRIVNNTKNFTINNLTSGVYSATVYGDGATGNAFNKLTPVTLAPVPTNLTVTNIQTTQAKLNWNALACASSYTVQYRKVGDVNWTTASTAAGVNSYIAKPLTPNTQYEWQVGSVISENGVSGTSAYSALGKFTTKATALIAGVTERSMTNENNELLIATYPNPAASLFTIQLNGIKTNGLGALWLKDLNGTTVWSKQQVLLSGVKGTQVNVSNLAAGMYLLQITDEKNTVIAVKKIIVSR